MQHFCAYLQNQTNMQISWSSLSECSIHAVFPRVYLHSSLLEMELGYIVWVCGSLSLKLFPQTGKSPWQGTDLRLLHDLMKQEISLAASASAWPETKGAPERDILFAWYSLQVAVEHIAAPVNAICGWFNVRATKASQQFLKAPYYGKTLASSLSINWTEMRKVHLLLLLLALLLGK